MSRLLRSRRSRVVRGVGAALAALLLAGCSAGQLTWTSTQRSFSGGAAGGAGDVAVRDAAIEFGDAPPSAVVYPAGATAPLEMSIVNDGATTDTLVGASSPVASSVQISGTTAVPGGQVVVVGTKPNTPPGSSPAQISLVGLRQDVRAGLTYPVVLNFAHAGLVPLDLPVANPTVPREPAVG